MGIVDRVRRWLTHRWLYSRRALHRATKRKHCACADDCCRWRDYGSELQGRGHTLEDHRDTHMATNPHVPRYLRVAYRAEKIFYMGKGTVTIMAVIHDADILLTRT